MKKKENDYVTTGVAAQRCSVTPDTILKWIKHGRLRARRTAGGHYRIALGDLQGFETERAPEHERSHFQYCWEYNAKGGVLSECASCVVYRTRAYRCYEVVKLAPEIGHQKHFCKKTCLECDYYKEVHQQPTNVLVISDNALLTARLLDHARQLPLNLAVTECEYTCSARIETFKPDFAVIDCAMGPERSRDIVHHLKEDPRIPFVRIILAARDNAFPTDCDREVFARIESPFDVQDLAECIQRVRPSAGENKDKVSDG